MKKKPKVHSSNIVYKGFFDVRQDQIEIGEGKFQSYSSLLLANDAAIILAQDAEGRWILNREYRHATGEFLLGCPGGRLEKGEDPILGGQREFFEETGYWSDEIVMIGCSYPFPGVCDQKIHYLWAKNAFKKGPQRLDPFEIIETELKTDSELRTALRQETNIDANLCAALCYKSLSSE